MNKEQLEKELAKINSEYYLWINGKTPSDFDEFMEKSEEFNSKIRAIESQLKILDGIKYEDIPDYGDLMTFDKFKSCCKSGLFIDYDGHGYLAMEDKMSNFEIVPSDFDSKMMYDNSKYNFTHVVWFNK